ncbi:hypothetical protein [Rhodococcus koreensis]
MSALAEQAEQYLRLRRALGRRLDEAARLLPRFVAYLDAAGVTTITVDVALQWVQRPDADPTSSVWARRMTVVRGFARHMSGIDPATEIPGCRVRRGRWRGFGCAGGTAVARPVIPLVNGVVHQRR